MTHFELSEKFQPSYKSGKPLFVTSDGYIIADDGININYLDRKNLQKIDQFNKENEEITCFVAGCDDYTVILADKSLMLKKIDRYNRSKKPKIWNSCHNAPIFTMCMNKTSTRLTTGGADNKIRIWHIGEEGEKSFSCNYHKSKISVLKNHPTKPMVVSSSLLDHEVAAWDTETGKQLGLFIGHQGTITSVDFHDGTNQMATSSRDETVIVWSCDNFEKICLIPTLEPIETCVILSGFMNQPATDQYLIMAGGASGIIKSISPSKKSIIQEFKKASLFANISQGETKRDESGLKTIRSIIISEFDNNKSIIVTRESDNIEFYSREMRLECELAGNVSDVKDLVLVGKNKDILLAVESAPYMRLFSIRKSYFQDDTRESRVSQSGYWPSQLISGGHTEEISCVSVCSEGLTVASGGKDGKLCVWRVEDDDSKLQMKLVTSVTKENDFVNAICVDKSGRLVYVNYSKDDSLAVFALESEKLARLTSTATPHSKPISAIAININGCLLATGSKDKFVKLWSFERKTNQISNRGILKGHKRCISSIQFSDVEQILLTSSLDKTINIWSIETLTAIQTINTSEIVYKVLFYNDEKQIISCDISGSLTVWNRNSTAISCAIDIHNEKVDCLTIVYDHEGKCKGFAAAGSSSMICLYKDESKKHLELLREEKELETKEQQELDNLLYEKNYISALKLAIKLNKPLLAFKILNDISSHEEIDEEMNGIQMLDTTAMGKSIQLLNIEELQKLCSYSVKWLSNQKTTLIGETVFTIINCLVPNLELFSWPEFVNSWQISRKLSKYRFKQRDENLNSVGFYDFAVQFVNRTEFIDLTMDTS